MKRLFYLDWLRLLATLCVVIIHVSAGYVSSMQPNLELLWFSANFFESLSRWAVPVFVMISGVLLLSDDRELSGTDFFIKRTTKVLIPFLGWSIIFYAYGVFKGYFTSSIMNFMNQLLINGIATHFWFFYMIIGIYLTTPLIKVLVNNAKKNQIEYFLVLWYISSVLLKLISFIYSVKPTIELNFVTGYIGYFILGYYLNEYDFKNKFRIISYLCLIIGVVGTFILTYYYTLENNGTLNSFWYEYFSPTTVMTSIGIFVLFKYKLGRHPLSGLLMQINKASLGIYILHLWLMQNYLWKLFPVVQNKFSLILVVPINILLTLGISFIATNLLQRIPIIKKLVP